MEPKSVCNNFASELEKKSILNVSVDLRKLISIFFFIKQNEHTPVSMFLICEQTL